MKISQERPKSSQHSSAQMVKRKQMASRNSANLMNSSRSQGIIKKAENASATPYGDARQSVWSNSISRQRTSIDYKTKGIELISEFEKDGK